MNPLMIVTAPLQANAVQFLPVHGHISIVVTSPALPLYSLQDL